MTGDTDSIGVGGGFDGIDAARGYASPNTREQLLFDVHVDEFKKVIGPLNPSTTPWFQRFFVCTRPNWWGFMKHHINLQELSGAFGDIGTFLPLLTALAIGRVNGKPQIAFGPALFFTGLFTMGLSTYFNIPIPVQPMKTIAAVAIAEKYPNSQIIAAGIISGIVLSFLAVTNIITLVTKHIPVCIVRGIQLGLGISIMMNGFKSAYVSQLKFISAQKVTQEHQIVWFGWDSVFVSLILGILCIVFMKSKRFPVAMVLFFYGICIAIYKYTRLRQEYVLPALQIGPDFEPLVIPSWNDFKVAFVYLFLPQLPLTLLNSVIALDKLAMDLYFPKHHEPAGIRRICFSLAGGNLLFCWFGMLPICHGAGGLASQHAFGARSSMSMVFLGMFKLFFALLFGSSCVVLLQKGIFPQSVLGVMLIFSGLSLAAVGLKIDVQNQNEVMLLLITAGSTLGLNTGAGFLLGFGTYVILRGGQHFGWIE
jgi:xanthine/uracil/vitamin C permease (AzgA family)